MKNGEPGRLLMKKCREFSVKMKINPDELQFLGKLRGDFFEENCRVFGFKDNFFEIPKSTENFKHIIDPDVFEDYSLADLGVPVQRVAKGFSREYLSDFESYLYLIIMDNGCVNAHKNW